MIRRIKLVQSDETDKAQVYSIVPSAVLPYMSGLTDKVEKALFLLRFGVPFWGLTYVFGRNDSYWYRQSCHFGRYGIGDIQEKVWDIYHATSATTFQKQVQAFSLWGKEHVDGTALDKINKLCRKADQFVIAFDHSNAYRTSNMIDRHMEPMNRWLTSMRYFHGHLTSAERQIRGWTLFHNFSPYCPRSKIGEE